ncbi:helix-turn-helix transcriptional regulator [Pseudomonas sp. DTU_2021_1001937_2_SI_NGA_ILE_001]|uniref:AraC family transcriptional regulator n=1 Tax=Pseudomonas sp. DTU_2021_1001937_2_SI_NGA_ILE_001 TaxID=3077589 RepID=UPI0028FC10BB|nr:helix-turn-helix transcriptional regulator [Pseudomonas sp. DTU_2021_1001937_2_SI_NGA_ILE_001]WNW11378.1 helix-turn-helix transcriptional regulator [Pseudomonas sp. DTU_2021_1001937_2_SI_NGA_ILE_001]
MQTLTQDYRHGDVVASHCHAQAQLIHASAGVMLVGTEQGDWVIPPGHALWVPAGVAHEVRMTGAVSMRTLLVPTHHSNQCLVIEVSTLLRELILAASIRPVDPLRQQHLLALIDLELQAARQVPAYIPLPRDRRLRRLCTELLDEPARELTLEQCGQRLNMSARTLARGFQRELGMSLGEWRTRTRMILSQQRLLRGVPIIEVALEHGYQSPSAFAATFKRVLGHSPRHCQARSG